ncbi:GRAS family protein RAD1 [Ricinus communis]|uniref:DELLA protein RGL1, putative n=1 Tax=Ricinus communis TaxID=3988 RepID=B9RAM0_RICCO|nr:GRAS family protein RAD1 [Ricinus communis]EEF51847.1 DELLA protein RGL1, putative [Ricinus communis]|eukprot:XP_002511245.1 DELLA protein RGL1 [Ricinus communis]
MRRRLFPNDLSHDETINETSSLDISLSAMAYYPYPYLPILENNESIFVLDFSDETREHKKRIKRALSFAESTGSDGIYNTGGSGSGSGSNDTISRSCSTNSLNSLPRLHFRDHIWTYTQRYLAAEAVEEGAEAMANSEEGENHGEGGNTDGMRLVQLLIACAEAVACRDKSHASALLSELRSSALVFGSSFQRVASCFFQGLADRLSLVQPLGTVSLVTPIMNIMDIASDKKEEALSLVYEICPHIQFGHFVANSSILEAFEGESFVHVVDLGMTLGLPHGHQWRQLIQSLANRAGKPPCRLRITAVGLCVGRFQTIGDELVEYAKDVGINLEFSVVESTLENLQPDDIKVFDGEVLVVNSILQLHCVVKESRGALNSVLQTIHALSPKILALVEQDSSHNGPFFLGRFMEALHYYSAIFDSLDAMLPRYDTRRAKMEQFYFAEEIKNIVSCEGPARVERHEKVDQWRRRMSRAGFQAAPVKMMAQAKQWLGKNKVCDGYTVVEEKGCLVLGWKSKPIVAASCWKC